MDMTVDRERLGLFFSTLRKTNRILPTVMRTDVFNKPGRLLGSNSMILLHVFLFSLLTACICDAANQPKYIQYLFLPLFVKL